MKKGSAVAIVIMIASFVLSVIFFTVSACFYITSGTKEIVTRAREGRLNELADDLSFVKVDEKEGVKVDLPGIHVLVDDKGADVYVVGIHVDMRDDEDEEKDDQKKEKETKKTEEEST